MQSPGGYGTLVFEVMDLLGILECAAYAVMPCLLGMLWELAAGVNGLLAALVTFLTLGGWYWAGFRYSKRVKNPAAALLLGNSVGILSFAVYLWQEYGAAVKTMWLQALSQKFAAPLTMITVRIVMRFSPVVDGVTQVSNTALQAVGLALMAILFAVAYFSARQRAKLLGK